MPRVTREIIERALAFNDVDFNPPNRLKRMMRKDPEAAEKMRVAIALDKARARGAKIPK